MSLIGTTVTLVQVTNGVEVEREALVLDVLTDVDGTVSRRAVNVVYVSGDASDVTRFGRAIKTVTGVAHEDLQDDASRAQGMYWRERGGAA